MDKFGPNFGSKTAQIYISDSALKDFFKILLDDEWNYGDKKDMNKFKQKTLFGGQIGHLGPN